MAVASDSHLDLDRAPYVLYGAKYIGPVSLAPPPHASDSHLDLDRAPYAVYSVKYIDPVASDSHLDLDRAPYVLYGVKYIGLVSLQSLSSDSHLDLDRAPYVVYGVKYIDPVYVYVFSGQEGQLGRSIDGDACSLVPAVDVPQRVVHASASGHRSLFVVNIDVSSGADLTAATCLCTVDTAVLIPATGTARYVFDLETGLCTTLPASNSDDDVPETMTSPVSTAFQCCTLQHMYGTVWAYDAREARVTVCHPYLGSVKPPARAAVDDDPYHRAVDAYRLDKAAPPALLHHDADESYTNSVLGLNPFGALPCRGHEIPAPCAGRSLWNAVYQLSHGPLPMVPSVAASAISPSILQTSADYESCTRFRSKGGSWSYSGSDDAITFTVDQQIICPGIGLYGKPEFQATVQLYDMSTDTAVAATALNQRFGDEPLDERAWHRLLFEAPYLLEAGAQYTVRVSIAAGEAGDNSVSGSNGTPPVFLVLTTFPCIWGTFASQLCSFTQIP